jgi:hypothetical protein
MANTTEKLVDLHIPRGYANDEPNFVIGVNGKNYVLPRGKTSKVPPAVKYEYDRSVRAQEKLYATSEKMIEDAKHIKHPDSAE